MADNVVGASIDEVVRLVGAPIKRQFTYLCCFTSNINSLKHEAAVLEHEKQELLYQVDEARHNEQVINLEVDHWLREATVILSETTLILDQVPNVKSGCLNIRARFSVSKRAKQTVERMKELQRVKFFYLTRELETRKKLEEGIMTTLKNGDINMIGIYGIGGVGKTTMAKRIMNQVLEEGTFKEAVMAIVGQQVDISRIQYAIGGVLGLNLKEEISDAARAEKLRERLSETTKTLLVLDDVLERLKLEDLGIPHDSKWCTILLTSHYGHVLLDMNVKRTFAMQVFSKEEAGFLFRERAGTCVDDPKLESIAKQVVRECRGLPIALTTVGAALKNEWNVSIWEDALRQLRQSDPNIPYYIVYNPLKLSYDRLGSKNAQSLILLCCLFPRDANIPIEKLAYFCMGLDIFEGIRDLEEVRNKTWALSKMLKSRSLLVDGDKEDEVRMHDLVHDVCKFIGKQKGYIGANDCTWISSFELFEQRNELRTKFRKLHLLFFGHSSQVEEDLNSDSAFLERIRDVSVLCMHNYSFTSLPLALRSLTNLNTLVLDSCEKLNTISVVGELENLEILICHRCGSLEELGPEIKGLNRLKSLVVSGHSGRRSHTFTSLTTDSPPNLNTLVLNSCEKLHTISVDLEILIYRNCDFSKLPSEIKGLNFLKELEYTRCSSTSLPHTMQSTRNLNSLVLDSCKELRTISIVKELVNLESLVCRKCDLIEELPQEIKGLKRLKVFELTGCSRLQRIGRGIISSLVGLEELKMLESFKKWEVGDIEGECADIEIEDPVLGADKELSSEIEEMLESFKKREAEYRSGDLACLDIEIEDPALAAKKMELSSEMEELNMLESFKKWEAKDGEGKNACLIELAELTKLRCLEIEIEDPALAEENMKLSSEIKRFDIRVSEGFGKWKFADHEKFDKKLSLRLDKKIRLGDWIKKQLLRDTELLYLYGNGANNVDLAKCKNIKGLSLGECNTMKNIVTSVKASVFSSIEFLHLFDLAELEDIWDTRDHSTPLQKLEELHLRDLPALQIWKSGKNNYAPLFPNLSSIEINNCPHLHNLGQENIAYHNMRAYQDEDKKRNNSASPNRARDRS